MKKAVILLALGSIVSANAHPGHDLWEHGMRHIASSPFHLGLLAGIGAVLGVAAFFVRSSRVRTWLQSSSFACLGLAVALALLR